MYVIFTELWPTEFHHHYKNFSGTTIIKLSQRRHQMNWSPGNFDIAIFVYVCLTCLKIVYPRGVTLSQQGVIFRIPFQLYFYYQQKDVLFGKSNFYSTTSFILYQLTGHVSS